MCRISMRKFVDFCPDFHFTKVVFLENVRVSFPGNNLISGSQYPEMNWFPGIVTQKSIYFRVTIPGNQLISGYRAREIATKKNLISWISPRKRKYFLKYFSMWIQGPGTVLLIHEKNQRSKISCYSPFKVHHLPSLLYLLYFLCYLHIVGHV